LDAVIGIFKEKDAVINQRPAVQKDLAELIIAREDITTQLKAVKSVDRYKAEKDVCREKLRGYCIEYAAYLVRLGREIVSTYLVDTFSSPVAKCKSDDSMTVFAEHIVENCDTYLDKMADVGVTQEHINAISDCIAELRGIIGVADLQNKANTSFNNEADKKLTKALAVIREKLDISMGSLRENNPDFYRLYQSARVVNKPKKASTQLVISVRDAISQKPIVNAIASVPFLKSPVKSDNNGVIVIKVGKNTDFMVKVTKPAYSEYSFIIDKLKLKESRTIEVYLNVLGLPSGS
jgi:hypothetical protein